MMGSRSWKIRGRNMDVSRRGLIMGVLNVTPDSFSDGGEFFETDCAVQQGLQMVKEGADIIDVGGESSRPGADSVSLAEDRSGVIPVIEKFREQSDVFISIDTCKSETARAALDAGADLVNDITGGRGDSEMLPLVAQRKAPSSSCTCRELRRQCRLRRTIRMWWREVGNFFRQQYRCALECGIDPMAVAFDPGIGFGKTLEHNLELLRNLDRTPGGKQAACDRSFTQSVSRAK